MNLQIKVCFCILHLHISRLPGIVVSVVEHDGLQFHKVAVVGGILSNSYLRKDLVHEALLPKSHYGLDQVFENWHSLPVIAVRTAVKFISPTGGQGYVRYDLFNY